MKILQVHHGWGSIHAHPEGLNRHLEATVNSTWSPHNAQPAHDRTPTTLLLKNKVPTPQSIPYKIQLGDGFVVDLSPTIMKWKLERQYIYVCINYLYIYIHICILYIQLIMYIYISFTYIIHTMCFSGQRPHGGKSPVSCQTDVINVCVPIVFNVCTCISRYIYIYTYYNIYIY